MDGYTSQMNQESRQISHWFGSKGKELSQLLGELKI